MVNSVNNLINCSLLHGLVTVERVKAEPAIFNAQSILLSQHQEATNYDVNHFHFNQFQINVMSVQDSIIHEA